MNYEIVCFLEQNASKHWTVVDKKKMKVFYYIDKEKSNLKIRIKLIATSASQESSEPLFERLYSLTQLKKQLDPASSDTQMELEELALELINKITGQTGVLVRFARPLQHPICAARTQHAHAARTQQVHAARMKHAHCRFWARPGRACSLLVGGGRSN